jgi:hypothetical protein
MNFFKQDDVNWNADLDNACLWYKLGALVCWKSIICAKKKY